MAKLGTDLLLVCSNVSPAALGDHQRIIDDLRELGERAGRRGLRIGHEALAWRRHVDDHRNAWPIVRRVGQAGVPRDRRTAGVWRRWCSGRDGPAGGAVPVQERVFL
jgi:hypothetical protein